jgi:flagellar biosynthesis GTPase FlhF
MKINVTHTCGHSEIHSVFGKSRERENKTRWLEGTMCTDCYKESVEQARAAAAELATKEAKEKGLPELRGSDKQIAWAERLRAEAFAEFEKQCQSLRSMDGPSRAKTIQEAIIARVDEELRDYSSAKWWIENQCIDIRRRLLDALTPEEHAILREEKEIAHRNQAAG